MLKELHIKNIAVIDELHIEFFEGFNVLTGETGAGKSILIDSINMALGSRISHDIIRHGCDFAAVDISFDVKNTAKAFLEELGIDTDDGIITLSRKLTADGKSTCRINGVLFPAAILKEAASFLIDIHGQSDNRSLLNAKNHLKLLDEYGNLLDDLEAYKSIYTEYHSLLKEIDSLTQDEEEKARRLELLHFQEEEIRLAQLKAGEDEELEKNRDRLYNMESIVSGAGTAYGALYGGESGTAYDLLRGASRALANVAQFDPLLSQSLDRLDSIIAETEDIASDINTCLSKTDFSMAELDCIEERLDLIGKLKRKYGNTIEEINSFAQNAADEANRIEKSDELLKKLNIEKDTAFEKMSRLASILTENRNKAARVLEEQIRNELTCLDMPKVRFSISITQKGEDSSIHYTEIGKDTVEFLISTNPGEEEKPLSKIASGGELSRIMLAIKSVLSETDSPDTMIFDEIDTGVSGSAAQRIAEKLYILSRGKQILAVTHLAQLASMADNHYLIKKSTEGDSTYTSVSLLSEDSRTRELARIIGGVSVTDLTLKNAEEMLEMAKEKKRTV